MDSEIFNEPYTTMKVQYCLSERFEPRCRLTIENKIFVAVCAACALKCLLCTLYLILRSGGDGEPLLTPGDAIESFITKPDDETKGMCTLNFHDLAAKKTTRTWTADDGFRPRSLEEPRQW